MQKSTLPFTIVLSVFACNCIYVIYFCVAKINKTESNKKLALPNVKRRNNRTTLLKVHLIAMRLAYQMSESRGKDILKNFPQYNKSTIYKHCKLPIVSVPDCRLCWSKKKQYGSSKKTLRWGLSTGSSQNFRTPNH